MAVRVSAFTWVLMMVLFAGIGFAAYKIGTIVPKNQAIEQIREYREQAQLVVTTYSDSMKRISKAHDDSFAVLSKEIQKKDVKIGSLTKKASKIEKENAKLVSAFLVAADSAPPICDPVVMSCKKALAGKDSLLTVKDSVIVEMIRKDTTRVSEIFELQQAKLAQMNRADSLDRTIMNFPKVKSQSDLFGFIKISPTNAFFGGTTLGLLLGLLF